MPTPHVKRTLKNPLGSETTNQVYKITEEDKHKRKLILTKLTATDLRSDLKIPHCVLIETGFHVQRSMLPVDRKHKIFCNS
jgi:hypothetical protein